MLTEENVAGSFRDPCGSVFKREGILYRQINGIYEPEYAYFIDSGLYDELIASGSLIPHSESDPGIAPEPEKVFKVIKPEPIPFISFPYEWCFSQFKDAALRTLAIQKKALSYGMSLKDASAYNIQFKNGKPVLIDTLSFERYVQGKPWCAYGQFCRHFLAPLILMSQRDIRLSQLLKNHIDGIPLDLTSTLLSRLSYFRLSSLIHIHIHAKSQKYLLGIKPTKVCAGKMGRQALLGLVDSLEVMIEKLRWRPNTTPWSNYYDMTNYSDSAMDAKARIITEFIEICRPKNVWDLGANTGQFSRLASECGIFTIAFDSDPACVETSYLETVKRNESYFLPLWVDLTNPSPDLGWANEERESFLRRGPADAIFALALIHHLAISNNVPFERIARFLSMLCRWLVIEFVPKTDSQVQRMLSTRDDIFPNYDRENFEQSFSRYFMIKRTIIIRDSDRTIYWMQRKA